MNSTSANNAMTTMMMTPWLHISGGDYFIFKTWQPSSSGAIAGACVGLVAFCIFDRWIASLRRQLEIYWRSRARALILQDQRSLSDQCIDDAPQKDVHSDQIVEVHPSYKSTSDAGSGHPRVVPPFIPAHDIPRGILHGVQALFSYILMLVIMTFNAAYVISIVLGLAIGEVVFGRIGRLYGA